MAGYCIKRCLIWESYNFQILHSLTKNIRKKKSLNLSLETWKICIHLKGTMGTDICFMCLNALACKGVITAPNTLQMAVPHSPPQDVTSFLPHMPPFMFPFIWPPSLQSPTPPQISLVGRKLYNVSWALSVNKVNTAPHFMKLFHGILFPFPNTTTDS